MHTLIDCRGTYRNICEAISARTQWNQTHKFCVILWLIWYLIGWKYTRVKLRYNMFCAYWKKSIDVCMQNIARWFVDRGPWTLDIDITDITLSQSNNNFLSIISLHWIYAIAMTFIYSNTFHCIYYNMLKKIGYKLNRKGLRDTNRRTYTWIIYATRQFYSSFKKLFHLLLFH